MRMTPRRNLTLILLEGVSFFAVSHAFAGGIAVDRGNGATMSRSTAGVDVLNIAAPTAAGVSHNKFTDFNVGPNGLIVNNMSLAAGVQSEANLGGTVTFNPNIGRGAAARVILNEVRGTSPSLLRGYTEIFGQKAAYILSNPNGIGCDGCGFINTSRLTLVAGRPEIENGAVKSFALSPDGTIEIKGRNFGLHVGDSPAELVAGAIRVAANVYAGGELRLLTGDKSFDYATGEVRSANAAQTGVAVDSSALGGMYAGAIKIRVSQNGMGIRTAGDLFADTGDLEITADGDIAVKTAAAFDRNVAVRSTGGSAAVETAAARGDLSVSAQRDAAVDTLAAEKVSVTADRLTLNGSVSGEYVSLTAGTEFLNKSANISANDLIVTAPAMRNETVLRSGNITLNLTGDLYNADRILAAGTLNISAENVRNFGQIAANGDISADLTGDYVNHRDSGLLSGGDIRLSVGGNLVNYLAEIYAAGDITLTGKADALFDVDYAAAYDNPYIENRHTSSVAVNNTQTAQPADSRSDDALEIYLPDENRTITVPPDAFADDAALGSSYTVDGYTVYLGRRIVTPREVTETVRVEYQVEVPYESVIEGEFNADGTPKTETKTRLETRTRDELRTRTEYDVSFQDADALTVVDARGNEVKSRPFEGADTGAGAIEPAENGSSETSDALQSFLRSESYTAPARQANAVVNFGGRIQAENNIGISADKLYNVALNRNTGENAYRLGYDMKMAEAPYYAGWVELGRYFVQDVLLTGEEGRILAGGTLGIAAWRVLNQSSTLSARRNLILTTADLQNVSYHETTEPLSIYYQMRTKKRKKLKVHHYTYNSTGTYTDVVYSKARSIIAGGENVVINAGNGTVQNDQTTAVQGRYFSGSGRPETIADTITVDTTLPTGTNGLFSRSENPDYLVTAGVDFLNNGNYIGSDYFFNAAGDGGAGFNQRKMLGDAAYETRLVMDAVRNATSGRYLTAGVASDAEQMKALFDAAIREQRALDLQIGVALTAEQIKRLGSDIIWYVEREIDGQKVLVPQIYLCGSTLRKIADGETGDVITGGDVRIAAKTITNAGKLSADGLLSLTADDLLNRGGLITADKTLIKGGNVLNETLKNRQETRVGQMYDLRETLGKTARIKGESGVQIDIDGDLTLRAGTVESGGAVAVKADNIVLDTVELRNRHENTATKKSTFGKTVTTTVTDSLKNVGSAIIAGGAAVIDAVKNLFAKGATIESGGDVQVAAGGETTLKSAADREYSHSRTKKSGFMKSADHIAESESVKQSGSTVTAKSGLTVVSGGDVNITASTVNTGGDAAILAGYAVNADGTVARNESGSLNITNDYDSERRYEKHERKSSVDAIKSIASETAKLVATGGMSAYAGMADNRGKAGVEATLGRRTKTESETASKTAVGSALNIGGNLTASAAENITIKGSDITGGGDIALIAGKDVNILSSENTTSESSRTETTTVKASAQTGNAYADAGYAAYDIVEAEKNVERAKSELNKTQRLHNEGRASADAVADAKENLKMAELNLASSITLAAKATKDAAQAASTSFGTGFYGELGVAHETTRTDSENQTVTSRGTTILAERDILIDAGNDLTQNGGLVASETGNIKYIADRDLNLTAGRNDSSSRTEEKQTGVSAGISSKSTITASTSKSKQSSSSQSTEYINAATVAKSGRIEYTVGNDMNASGYNALAETITANIGGNLTLVSLQNTETSHDKSGYTSAGASRDGWNVGFGSSKGDFERRWVDDITSIIGTNGVEITVGDTLTLTGAKIANENDGIDGGNLTISAKHLDASDLTDIERRRQRGNDFSISAGDGLFDGKTTVGRTNKAYEIEGVTRATIGQGTLDIADGSGGNVNRDINKTQEITKDIITAASDYNVTIDNRLIDPTGKGQKDAWNDLKDAAKNANQIKNGLTNNIISQTVVAAVSGDDVIDTIKNYVGIDQSQTEIQADKLLRDILNGATNYSTQDIQNALQSAVDIAGADGGFVGDVKLSNVGGDASIAFAYTDASGSRHEINLNLAKIDLSDPSALVRAIYHETTNETQHAKSERNADKREELADKIWTLKNFGNDNTNGMTGAEWVDANKNSDIILSGTDDYYNAKLDHLNTPDASTLNEKTDIFSRDLSGIPAGTHDGLLIYGSKEYMQDLISTVEGADIFPLQSLKDGTYGIITGAGNGEKKDEGKLVPMIGHKNDIYAFDNEIEEHLERTNIASNKSEFEFDRDMLRLLIKFNDEAKNGNSPEYEPFGINIDARKASAAERLLKGLRTLKENTTSSNIIQSTLSSGIEKTTDFYNSSLEKANKKNEYNCIDFTYEICKAAGGTNCSVNHSGIRPKHYNSQKLKEYFGE